MSIGLSVPPLVHALRPRQWVKNLALFAPLYFSGHLFNTNSFYWVTAGFIAFCFLSSSSYILNDIIDLPRDRLHPYKKKRPLARNAITKIEALVMSVGLALSGLVISYAVGIMFFVFALSYLVLHYAYTIILRRIMLIDVMTIATGYFMRVYAGALASGYSISIWLALAVFALSLLIAIGKRRAELTLLGDKIMAGRNSSTALLSGRYSENMINTYTAMFATAAFLTYCYYTFLAASGAQGFFFPSEMIVDPVFIGRKWLMVTIPVVMYGIMRYLQIIFGEQKGTLEDILFRDRQLIGAVILWVLLSFVIVYGIGG
jgi:4-hydroxybenzoate polyprenyltransferase